MSTPASPIATAEVGDFSIDTNTQTSSDIKSGIEAIDRKEGKEVKEESKEKSPKQKTSEAAAELGRRGGEASARAREEREKTAEPDKPAPKTAAKAVEEPEDPEEPEDKRPLGKPRHDPRARMLQATHQAAELKRALAARDSEMAAMRSQLQELQNLASRATGQRPDPRTMTQPPDFSDYDTVEEFARASSQYEIAQYERLRQQREQIHAYAQEIADRAIGEVQSFQQKIVAAGMHTAEGAEGIHPHITDLVPSAMLPRGVEPDVFNGIADAILRAEDPAAVMRHISDNMEEFERLISCPNQRAIDYVMQWIEKRAGAGRSGEPDNGSASRSRTPIPASSARPPVSPVRSSAENATTNDSELGDDQFLDKYIGKPWRRR